jgi:hypothetical protein
MTTKIEARRSTNRGDLFIKPGKDKLVRQYNSDVVDYNTGSYYFPTEIELVTILRSGDLTQKERDELKVMYGDFELTMHEGTMGAHPSDLSYATVDDLINALRAFSPDGTKPVEISLGQYNKKYPVAYMKIDSLQSNGQDIRIVCSLPNDMRTSTRKS